MYTKLKFSPSFLYSRYLIIYARKLLSLQLVESLINVIT